jgi:hypothetical protein
LLKFFILKSINKRSPHHIPPPISISISSTQENKSFLSQNKIPKELQNSKKLDVLN